VNSQLQGLRISQLLEAGGKTRIRLNLPPTLKLYTTVKLSTAVLFTVFNMCGFLNINLARFFKPIHNLQNNILG